MAMLDAEAFWNAICRHLIIDDVTLYTMISNKSLELALQIPTIKGVPPVCSLAMWRMASV